MIADELEDAGPPADRLPAAGRPARQRDRAPAIPTRACGPAAASARRRRSASSTRFPGAERSSSARAAARRGPRRRRRRRGGARSRVLPGALPAPGREPDGGPTATVRFWRCANERAEAQAVAREIEHLLAAGRARPEDDLRPDRRRPAGARAGWSRPRSRSAASPSGAPARPRSSSGPRSATRSPGCGCSPTRPTPPRSSGR